MPRRFDRTMTLTLAVVCSLLTFSTAQAEESPTAAPPAATPAAAGSATPAEAPQRGVQSLYDGQDAYDPIDEETFEKRKTRSSRSTMGPQISVYYDGLSNYSKTVTNNATDPSLFTNQALTGLAGVQVMFVAERGPWEFGTGVDYTFQTTVQNDQPYFGGAYYVAHNQTVEVMGIKGFQLGYRMAEGRLRIVPFGSLGLYYGRNILKLYNYVMAGGAEATITYAKIMALISGGVRLDYNFTMDGSFTGGLGIEIFYPAKIADHLAQSGTPGTNTSELPGREPELQNNMDFMSSVGGRIMASIAAHF